MISNGYKYQLEPYRGQKTRHTCPSCGKKHNFARYIDVDGNYLGDDVGRCNSEVSCAYHKPPDGNGVITDGRVFVHVEKEPSFLRNKDLIGEKYDDSLFKFLCTKFSEEEVKTVYDRYRVRSTNVKWSNSTVFYQIDIMGRFRTGKIIQYNNNGKRVKEPYSRIYWVHNLITDIEFNLSQCLFGEHLLRSYDGKIYLVESEKTCLIASLFYEDSLFLATGGLSNLNSKKLEVLKWKNVEAIPDKGGYKLWKEKLEPLGITVNKVMEEADCPDGSDLADLLID